MKKVAVIFLACLTAFSCWTGCGNQKAGQKEETQTLAIGNPWSDWASVEAAESAAGFSFGLPEVIADRYTAAAFRTLNNELIEVIYRDGDLEVRVRKQKGEGLDISGDYNQYDICTEESIHEASVITYQNSGSNALKQIISCQGYSWSVTAPDGCGGNPESDFVNEILGK